MVCLPGEAQLAVHVDIVNVEYYVEEKMVVELLLSYIEKDSSARVLFGREDGFLR